MTPNASTITPLVKRIAEILDTERAFRLYYSDDGRTRVAEKIAAALRPVDDAGLIERVENLAFQRENNAVVVLTLRDAKDLRAIVAALKGRPA